ncbi:transglutaminase domain-containing protein [Sporosarcina cyprini]|uniref:transglutaminase domain-containing protein n=1 Tax=Sporosarcina cyprini TaxID=2910523 RepID=UPI001EDE2264|nr:transglutaminase-like domain-containing protein [Sporosarcina cyprini]MCG3088458.1 transglutaminase-like domain-containing protein [Sporosarcina cyprini]
MSKRQARGWLISLLFLFLLGACAKESAPPEKDTQPTAEQQKEQEKEKENEFEAAVTKKNTELESSPLELTSYAEEVGATLAEPTHTNFAVNEFVTIEGTVEQHEQLQEHYVWIKIQFLGDSITDPYQEFFVPIKDGKFKQEAGLFNGEGEYRVTVLLPSKTQSNYYYDLADFKVFNVNPSIQRDMTFTPFAQEAGLKIQDPDSGYLKGNKVFTLTGTIDSINEDKNLLMVELTKDTQSWKHIIPIKNGEFSYDIPLFYGKGVHKLKVYVPDKERDNYYQDGTVLYIDNESDLVTEPIIYMTTYEERGVHLISPAYGGQETDLTYRIKGSIDKDAPFAKETTHLYISTKKDGEEALDVIPVEHYQFDDEFYLRFGPGTYEVTVSVPEIKEKNSDRFYYYNVAQFSVTNTAKDQRDLLPSRGVQSDSPKIISIANDLMKNSMTEREKAKAVYEYTAKNISYDVDKMKNSEFEWDDSALKVLELQTGICQDYTYLAIALLRAGGMEARYVAGTAGAGFNYSRHAWVEVKVDGEWLTMDPTWGSGYIEKDKFVAHYNEDYFEPNKEAFKTHTRHGVEY